MPILKNPLMARVFLILFSLLMASACTRTPPPALITNRDPEQRKVQSKMHYLLRCASCHGEFGEGKIGPNLTDDFWIHGDGTKASLVTMISEGVVQKGMPGWKHVFHADDISALADFVQTLQGTTPKNAKAPEGEPKSSKLEVITPPQPAGKTQQIPTH